MEKSEPIAVRIVQPQQDVYGSVNENGNIAIESGEKFVKVIKEILNPGARFDKKTLNNVKHSAQQAWKSIKQVCSGKVDAERLTDCRTKVIDLAIRITPYVCLIGMVGCVIAGVGMGIAAIPTGGATLPVAGLLLAGVPTLAKIARSTQKYTDTLDKKASVEKKIGHSLSLYNRYKADQTMASKINLLNQQLEHDKQRINFEKQEIQDLNEINQLEENQDEKMQNFIKGLQQEHQKNMEKLQETIELKSKEVEELSHKLPTEQSINIEVYGDKKEIFEHMLENEKSISELKEILIKKGSIDSMDQKSIQKKVRAKYAKMQEFYLDQISNRETKELYQNVFNSFIKVEVKEIEKEVQEKLERANV